MALDEGAGPGPSGKAGGSEEKRCSQPSGPARGTERVRTRLAVAHEEGARRKAITTLRLPRDGPRGVGRAAAVSYWSPWGVGIGDGNMATTSSQLGSPPSAGVSCFASKVPVMVALGPAEPA